MFATACPLTGRGRFRRGRTVAAFDLKPDGLPAFDGGGVRCSPESLTGGAAFRRRGRSPDRLADGCGVPAFADRPDGLPDRLARRTVAGIIGSGRRTVERLPRSI